MPTKKKEQWSSCVKSVTNGPEVLVVGGHGAVLAQVKSHVVAIPAKRENEGVGFARVEQLAIEAWVVLLGLSKDFFEVGDVRLWLVRVLVLTVRWVGRFFFHFLLGRFERHAQVVSNGAHHGLLVADEVFVEHELGVIADVKGDAQDAFHRFRGIDEELSDRVHVDEDLALLTVPLNGPTVEFVAVQRFTVDIVHCMEDS
mmetsp:Transcript_18915/g.38205  ORF Transcript_18915/g.38205 Transcript_18915/m.38205 type:complete len:200 (-) Transcript_18915:779-1378(-)